MRWVRAVTPPSCARSTAAADRRESHTNLWGTQGQIDKLAGSFIQLRKPAEPFGRLFGEEIMQKSLCVALLASIACITSADAKSLNGNLDYEVSATGDRLQLALKNLHVEIPATVTAIKLLLPDSTSDKTFTMPVKLAHPLFLSSSLTVDLGSVAEIAHEIAPNRKASEQPIAASEEPGCANCDSIPFALQLRLEYPGGAKQEILTGGYLRFPPR